MRFAKAFECRVSNTRVLPQCDFKLGNPRSWSNLKCGDSQRTVGADGCVIRSSLDAKQHIVNNLTPEAGVNWIAGG